jgi:hypothetical protein
LIVECNIDKGEYPNGMKVDDEEPESIQITRDDFHGEWNYTISP